MFTFSLNSKSLLAEAYTFSVRFDSVIDHLSNISATILGGRRGLLAEESLFSEELLGCNFFDCFLVLKVLDHCTLSFQRLGKIIVHSRRATVITRHCHFGSIQQFIFVVSCLNTNLSSTNIDLGFLFNESVARV